MISKIDLANKGFERSKNVRAEDINAFALKELKVSVNALEFWKHFVIEKTWNVNTQKCGYYLQQFIKVNNSFVNDDEKIKMENIQMIMAQLLDCNQDGYVTPKEIAAFFKEVWD